jgi:hypothetical protein
VNKKHNLPNVLDFAYACLIICWVSTSVLEVFKYIFEPSVLAYMQAGELRLADYICFYQAGKIFLDSVHNNIYDWNYQLSVLNQIIAPLESARVFAIPYAPTAFVFFVPLALFSLTTSYQLFIGLSFLVALITLYIVCNTYHPHNKIFSVMFSMGAFVCLSSIISFRLGQITWILLFLMVAYVLCFQKKQDYLAGIALGLFFVKQQYAIFLLLPAIFCRRIHVLYGLATVLAVLAVIVQYKFGIHSFVDYLKYLLEISNIDKYNGVNPALHVNLKAFLSMFLPKPMTLITSFLFFVIALTGIAFMWLKLGKDENRHKQSLLWSCTIITSLFFSPHAHYHDMLLLILPAAMIIPEVSPSKLLKISNKTFRLYAFTFCMIPLLCFIDCLLVAYVKNVVPYTHMLVMMILTFCAIKSILNFKHIPS